MPSDLHTNLSCYPLHSPQLGVGLGLRRSLYEETLANRDKIDWLEIVPENYMGRGGNSLFVLEKAMDLGFSIVPHGVSLSLGSIDPLNERYLDELKTLFERIHPPWFSDHLSFCSVDGLYFNDLIPLPFTWEAVNHVVERIRLIQERFEPPFLIENVSRYAQFAEHELTEAQFLAEILERSDCGLMLDVNNIYVNAHNHGFEPLDFLDQIPLNRTVQVHVAGHLKKPHAIIDTHGAPVCPDVWSILTEVLRRTPVNGILLERDTEIPPMKTLLAELDQIRDIVAKVEAEKGVPSCP
jgi:uncharacterized protein